MRLQRRAWASDEGTPATAGRTEEENDGLSPWTLRPLGLWVLMTSIAQDAGWIRIAAPVLVGAAVIALWEAFVWWFEVKPWFVPSPTLVARTLVADWELLSRSLLVTLEVTLLAFLCATALGTLIAFLF